MFSRFFLADVAFTCLPLAVIAFLRGSLGEFDSEFFTIPEWSFAAIIIYGLAMTRALELKVRYQKDTSENVFALTRVCILGLIAAVISLALAQMQSSGLPVSVKCLVTFQSTVLAFGLFLLFMSHFYREMHIQERSSLPEGIDLVRYFTFIVEDLESEVNNIDRLSGRLARRNAFDFDSPEQDTDFKDWVHRQTRKVDHLLNEVSDCLIRLKQTRGQWKYDETSAQPSAARDGA